MKRYHNLRLRLEEEFNVGFSEKNKDILEELRQLNALGGFCPSTRQITIRNKEILNYSHSCKDDDGGEALWLFVMFHEVGHSMQGLSDYVTTADEMELLEYELRANEFALEELNAMGVPVSKSVDEIVVRYARQYELMRVHHEYLSHLYGKFSS